MTRRRIKEFAIRAIAMMPWRYGLPEPRVGPTTLAVEVVVSRRPEIALHRGTDICRWEIWLPPDWIETVVEKGLAWFPEDGARCVVLQAVEVPLMRPEGADACYQLVVASPYRAWGGCVSPTHDFEVGVRNDWHAVVLGGVAAVGGSPLQAMSRAMLKWEKALGVER